MQVHYPEENYSLQTRGYNFKDASYVFNFIYQSDIAQKSWAYTVSVDTKLMPKNIVDFTLHYDSTDEDISQQWSDEGSKYVQNLLQELPIQVFATYSIQVPVDFIKSQPAWKPNIPLPVKPSIYIETSFYNGRFF